MASNKTVRIGPVALGTAAANIANPPTLTGGTGLAGTNAATYLILRHIRLVNKSNVAVTASLFIGATSGSAAGTEFAFNGTSIPANSPMEWFGATRIESTDFLTGLAGAGSSITLTADAEIGIAG